MKLITLRLNQLTMKTYSYEAPLTEEDYLQMEENILSSGKGPGENDDLNGSKFESVDYEAL